MQNLLKIQRPLEIFPEENFPKKERKEKVSIYAFSAVEMFKIRLHRPKHSPWPRPRTLVLYSYSKDVEITTELRSIEIW